MISLDSFLLSFALGIDAAIVAFAIGLIHPDKTHRPGLKLALWFGSFQALMSWLGYLAASSLSHFGTWVQTGSGVIFILLGLKLLWDARSDSEAASYPETHRAYILLAIATSVDALAAGLGLGTSMHAGFTIVLIGIVAFSMTLAGALASRTFKKLPESWLEVIGGLILIFLGAKSFV